MPTREINPFTALTRIRSQFLRTQWSTRNHQRVDTTTPQTAQPSGLTRGQKETGRGRSEEDRGKAGEVHSPPQWPATRCLLHLQWPSGDRHSVCSERIGHRNWAEQAVLHFAKQWIPQDNKEGQHNGVGKEGSQCQEEGHLRHRHAVQSAVSRGAAAQHWYSRVQSLQTWSTSMTAWGRVTRPCSSSLSVSLLMVASLCIISSGPSLGLQEMWLQASAFDWPITLLPPRKVSCLTDMTKKLPAQRTTSGQEEEEPWSSPNTSLPCREAILHNSKNKNMFNNIICSYPLPHNIPLVNKLDCAVTHDEADPLQLHAESGGRRRSDYPNPQWRHRRPCALGVLDIEDASCC